MGAAAPEVMDPQLVEDNEFEPIETPRTSKDIHKMFNKIVPYENRELHY